MWCECGHAEDMHGKWNGNTIRDGMLQPVCGGRQVLTTGQTCECYCIGFKEAVPSHRLYGTDPRD